MSAAWNAWKIRQAKQAADIERLQRELAADIARLEREIDRAGVKIKPKADAANRSGGRVPKSAADAASRPRRSLLGRLIALFWPA